MIEGKVDLKGILAHARSIISETVISSLRNPAAGAAWLAAADTSQAGKLLAICMALDVQVRAVPCQTYVDILNGLPSPSGNACVDFITALQQHPAYNTQLLGTSQIGAPPPENGDNYVRVLEIGSFAQYYDTRSGRGLRADEISEVRRIYFERKGSLGHVQEVWSGKNSRVWVLPRNDLEKVRLLKGRASGGAVNGSFPGTPVLDALGLPLIFGYGPNGGPDLVAVHYPPECESVQPRQPTAIDADWAAKWVFYISYGGVDGWGRTQSLSGRTEGCRERVHPPFQPLTPAFRGEYIGEAEPVELNDLSHVLESAATRYAEFVMEHTRRRPAAKVKRSIAKVRKPNKKAG